MAPETTYRPWRMAVVYYKLNQVAAAPVVAHVPDVGSPVLGNEDR